jgi:hypothetical protein
MPPYVIDGDELAAVTSAMLAAAEASVAVAAAV